MSEDRSDTADLWAAVLALQDSVGQIREDLARLAVSVGMVLPLAVHRTSGERSETSPAARHLDHVCDNLVLAVRTLTEVERRTTDPALGQLCRDTLDCIAHVRAVALDAA